MNMSQCNKEEPGMLKEQSVWLEQSLLGQREWGGGGKVVADPEGTLFGGQREPPEVPSRQKTATIIETH